MWIGSFDGRLLVARQDRTDQVLGSDVLDEVTCLMQTRDGAMWVGTQGNGLVRVEGDQVRRWTPNEGLTSDPIRSLFEDSAGNLWVGTQGSGLIRMAVGPLTAIGEPEGLASDGAWTIAPRRQGGVWIGSSKGLDQIDEDGVQAVGLPPSLNGSWVRSVFEDGEGRLWVGSYGSGLARREDGRWRVWTTADGLADSSVVAVTGDRAGGVWVGTTQGLHRVTGDEITPHDGLEVPYIRVILVDSRGRAWFGTNGGGERGSAPTEVGWPVWQATVSRSSAPPTVSPTTLFGASARAPTAASGSALTAAACAG